MSWILPNRSTWTGSTRKIWPQVAKDPSDLPVGSSGSGTLLDPKTSDQVG